MLKVDIVAAASQLIQQTTGVYPNTDYWIGSINTMLARGITGEQIISATKRGLADTYHCSKLCDKGLAWINWNYHQLATHTGPGKKMTIDLRLRRKWEVAIHEREHRFMQENGRRMDEHERRFELEKFCTYNRDFDEYQEYTCNVCKWGFDYPQPPIVPKPLPKVPVTGKRISDIFPTLTAPAPTAVAR